MNPRILVVEDEVLIALDLMQHLEDANFDPVGPCVTVSDALDHLRRSDCCDAAIIDVNLGRETAEPVAKALLAAEKPFIVVSGYAAAQLSEVFASAPSLTKPLRMDQLVILLRQILQSRQSPLRIVD
jgi:DNA-binding NtrC family response regulator